MMGNSFPLVSSNYLREDFDAFLVDLWGTIHNGKSPLDNALRFLMDVMKEDKPLIFVTNSPSSSDVVQDFLGNEIGIWKGEHYHKIITAGEIALDFIERNSLKGKKCLTWGESSEIDDWIIKRCGLKVVESLRDKPDFILKHRMRHVMSWSEKQIEEYDDELNEALEMGIPIVCANPDRRVLFGRETRFVGAGEISHRYEEKGGEVFWCGKPAERIYEFFREEAAKLGFRGNGDEVACIGDNLETDIPGGKKADMSTFFFTRGVHSQELIVNIRQGMDEKSALSKLFSSYSCPEPDGILKSW